MTLSLAKKLTLLMSGASRPFDYYVDSVAGNDANAGTSQNAPIKTLGALPALAAGKRVGLKADSTWREKLILAADNIAFGAYGVGAAPVITGADVITGAWTKLGGYTNIWYKSLTIEVAPVVPSDPYVRAWEDDSPMIRASGLANLEATPGSYLPDSSTVTPIALYIHATGSGDPNSNGKVYEYNKRAYSINAAAQSGIKMTGITCKRNLCGGGSGLFGRSVRLVDCRFDGGGKHNVLYGDGFYLENVICQDSQYSSGRTLFVYNENTPVSLGGQYVNCQAIGTTANDAGLTGFYGHRNTSGDFGTVAYTGCSVVNAAKGFDGVNASAVMDDCTVNATVDVAVYATQNYTITNSDLRAKTTVIQFGLAGITVDISGTDCRAPAPSPAPISNTGAANCLLTVDNCQFNKATFDYWIIIFTAAGCSIDVSNSTFAGLAVECYKIAADTTVASDYNAFKTGSGFLVGSTPYTFAQWQALGYDQNSTIA